jgi:hypothetical protein
MHEAFETPENYSIQKKPGGVDSLHEVAPIIIEHCRTVNNYKVDYMVQKLKYASEILNSEFWVKGGEASLYTSRGAQRQLSQKINELLPAVTLDPEIINI